MNNQSQHCPICHKAVEYSNHFPNFVCYSCAENACDANGEPVIFYHARFNDQGFQGYYRRKNELIPFSGNICYVNGIKCQAMDDYFGGIVIQPVTDTASQVHIAGQSGAGKRKQMATF